MIAVSLSVGIAGYHWIAGFSWVDSLLNASMLLGGMGPVGDLPNEAAKLFASVPEQGWSLLCNGVIVFDVNGELLPDCSVIEPHRGPAPHTLVPAA